MNETPAVFEFKAGEEFKAAKKARHIVNNSYPAELTEMRDRLKVKSSNGSINESVVHAHV